MPAAAIVTLLAFAMTGCGSRALPRVTADAPNLGEQLRRQDEALVGQRFRTVLDFENRADAAFVTPAGVATTAGHTGASALRCGSTASVNVSSLLFGLELPAEFTLIGGYVRPTAGDISAALIADGREVARTTRRVPPGTWAVAAVDLAALTDPVALARAGSVRLVLSSAKPFDLDDVMLIDNRRTLVSVPGGWSIRQRGFMLSVERPGRPTESFRTFAAGDDGWAVQEASALRLLLSDGRGTSRTLLPDGRTIVDGRTPDGRLAAPPAVIAVDEATARLDRESPGDADDDGFDERRAAFRVVARTPRPRLTLVARGGRDTLVEIRNLPPGPIVVVANGKLIDATTRPTADSLLVRVPLAAGPAVEVTVGVRGDRTRP